MVKQLLTNPTLMHFLENTDLPDIYFEFTSNDFAVSHRKVREEVQHLSDIWETERIFRIPGCIAGCYLVYDLHKTPHYQRPYAMRSLISNDAQEKGLLVESVDVSDFEEKNFLYHYSIDSTTFDEFINPRISEFDLPKIINMLDKEKVSNRGNIAKTVGWTSINYQYNSEDKINIPRRTEITALDRKMFKTLTTLLKDIFIGKIYPVPFSTDPTRKDRFAESLLKVDGGTNTSSLHKNESNVFEAITYAMSYVSSPDRHLLIPHIDHFNCSQDGYNIVFSVYFHTMHPTKENTLVRVVFIGYSRKSLLDYMNRLSLREVCKDHLNKYISFIGIKKDLTLENTFPFRNNYKDATFHYTLPFVDKCAFYSIFVSAIYDLSKVFYNESKPLCFEDILELALPIAWLPTGYYYYQVLKMWESSMELPTYNLSMALVDKLVDFSGGLSKGCGQRFTPYCNRPIPKKRIINSLRGLKRSISLAKSKCWNAKDLLISIKQCVYCCGDIGAQHLLSCLTLLKIVDDPKFVRDTIILKGTQTEKRMRKIYKMSHNVINGLYEELASERFNGNTRMVENLVCEFFRDLGEGVLNGFELSDYEKSIKKRVGKNNFIKKPDLFHPSQALFIEKEKVINRYFYNEDGICKTEEVMKYFIVSKDKDWINSQTDIFTDNDVVQVKGIPRVCVDIPNLFENTKKRQKVEPVSDVDISTKRLQVESNFELDASSTSSEELCLTNPSIFQTVKQMYFKAFTRQAVPSDKFEWNSNWFLGEYKMISVEEILQTLTNSTKSKQSKLVKFLKETSRTGQEMFTATINSSKCQIVLSSKLIGLPTNGYCESKSRTFSNRHYDIVAYYKSKEHAKRALVIAVMCLMQFKISKVSFLKSFFFEKDQRVALFQTLGNKSERQFVGLLWSNSLAQYFMDFPVLEDDLYSIWDSYKLC